MFDANFDYVPEPGPLLEAASQVFVEKYDPDAAENKFSTVPNVVCETVQYREGANPPTARFHYVLDGTKREDGWPTQIEEIFSLLEDTEDPDAEPAEVEQRAIRRARYTILPDDEICVAVYDAAGVRRIVFRGYAEAPETNISGSSQILSFSAIGVETRLFDNPIHSRLQRANSLPHVPGEDNRDWIHGAVRFNPDGKPNCTAEESPEDLADGRPLDPDLESENTDTAGDTELQSGDFTFPIFMDEKYQDGQGNYNQTWKLDGFCSYLMAVYNDESIVLNPHFRELRDLIANRKPAGSEWYFDPSDSGTYEDAPIEVVDFNASGMPWPLALERQLSYHGFGLAFDLKTDENGEPDNRLRIFRKDTKATGEPKPLKFQRAGQALDTAKTNVAELSLTRDYQDCYNAVIVDTAPTRYEVSVVLAPGYQPALGDESEQNSAAFLKSKLTNATGDDRNKYRLYIADESGEGHWDYATSAWVTNQPPSLASFIFDDPETESYLDRRRPGTSTLISKDSANQPLRATLEISRDYNGEAPAFGATGGTWQTVTGGWQLLKDRLGIYVDCENVRKWNIGKSNISPPQIKSESFDAITAQANPTTNNPRFYLRLTTVIEGDRRPVPKVRKRQSSAYKFTRTLYSHAIEAYKKEVIAPNSLYNTSDQAVVERDDTEDIEAQADQLQQSRENPQVAGQATIPYYEPSYQIGDQISTVEGRGINLQANVGTEQGEGARYPVVVGITYQFDGRQSTTLLLSDRRADPR